jgi:hypothetical protein
MMRKIKFIHKLLALLFTIIAVYIVSIIIEPYVGINDLGDAIGYALLVIYIEFVLILVTILYTLFYFYKKLRHKRV